MKCDKAQEFFSDYIENALDQPMVVALETHLNGCEACSADVSSLRDMKKPDAILQHCIEINRLENVADKILRSALARLFREEKEPIAVIKWKEIFEILESATDRCEDVANVIEGVVLENS